MPDDIIPSQASTDPIGYAQGTPPPPPASPQDAGTPPPPGTQVQPVPPPPDVSAALGGRTPPAVQPPVPPKPSLMSDVFHALGDVFGGPKTEQRVQADGSVANVPLTRAERIANTAGIYLRGAAAGASQTGPGHLGKAALAGAQEQQQFQKQNFEQTEEQAKLTQQQIMNKATVAYHNNEMLMREREYELAKTESNQKIDESNTMLGLKMSEMGATPVQLLYQGKNINGTPGNEADMMKYFGDPKSHQAPEGMTYMGIPTNDPGTGKRVYTVYQVPLNELTKTIGVSGTDFEKMTGLKAPGDPNQLHYVQQGQLIDLHSKFVKDNADEARAAAEKTEADTRAKMVPSEIEAKKAQAARDFAEATALGGAQLETPDATGFVPNLPAGGIKQYNTALNSFKKNIDALAQTEATYEQFNQVLSDIKAGKDMTGAESVVALFNAIGISVEPLRGKGMRIQNTVVQSHENARGFGQDLYQKWLSLKNGEIITPQQVKDYATIAEQVRTNQYNNLINQMHADGVKADAVLGLLRGNGRPIDDGTIKIFINAAGGDPAKGAAMAQKFGWQ